MAEQPTVTEPVEEPAKTEEGADTDILAKLKELQVDDPQKLENMAVASSQAGKLANDLGETRAELAQVKEYLASMQTTQPQNYEYTDGIDVGSVVRKEAKTASKEAITEYMQEFQANQQKAQEAYFRDMGKVQGDKRYPALKGAYEKHMANFNTQQKIQTGTTTALEEYQRIKDAYFDILEEKQANIGKMSPPEAPPHVEGTESHVAPMPTTDEEMKGKVKNLVDPEKGWVGTDENVMDLVKTILPADDPIFT